MKKVIYLMVAFISLALCSCGSNDNTCVKEIVKLIDEGTQQRIATDNGTLDISDIPEDDFFVTPDGNTFANPKIKAIIDANPKYKLTDEDKEMLNNAIDKLCPEVPVRYQPTVEGRMLDDINRKAREYNLANIKAAKTLGDLL